MRTVVYRHGSSYRGVIIRRGVSGEERRRVLRRGWRTRRPGCIPGGGKLRVGRRRKSTLLGYSGRTLTRWELGEMRRRI
jgi:hypothetical protein